MIFLLIEIYTMQDNGAMSFPPDLLLYAGGSAERKKKKLTKSDCRGLARRKE